MMLYKFFITQWYQPCRGDWTEVVQQNLNKISIPCDFAYISEAFKKIVKTKAKEYALKQPTEKQQKHSKMEGLNYTEIKPQEYLMMKNARVDQIY